MRLGPKSTEGAGLAEAAKKSGVPLDLLDVADAATHYLYGTDPVLIRPDQHITWCGAKSSSDASERHTAQTGWNARTTQSQRSAKSCRAVTPARAFGQLTADPRQSSERRMELRRSGGEKSY